jgi:ABC-type branched-subunit amino acid transport system ATPase component
MQSDYENILQVDGLSKYFGGLAAVSNCSLKPESLVQMAQAKQPYLI